MLVSLVPVLRNIDLIPVAHQKYMLLFEEVQVSQDL